MGLYRVSLLRLGVTCYTFSSLRVRNRSFSLFEVYIDLKAWESITDVPMSPLDSLTPTPPPIANLVVSSMHLRCDLTSPLQLPILTQQLLPLLLLFKLLMKPAWRGFEVKGKFNPSEDLPALLRCEHSRGLREHLLELTAL